MYFISIIVCEFWYHFDICNGMVWILILQLGMVNMSFGSSPVSGYDDLGVLVLIMVVLEVWFL